MRESHGRNLCGRVTGSTQRQGLMLCSALLRSLLLETSLNTPVIPQNTQVLNGLASPRDKKMARTLSEDADDWRKPANRRQSQRFFFPRRRIAVPPLLPSDGEGVSGIHGKPGGTR